jgi:hypothetical protein
VGAAGGTSIQLRTARRRPSAKWIEETGYRPRSVEYVMSFQLIIGSADSGQAIYLARGADRVGAPDANETEAVRWFPLAETPRMISDGAIVGTATVIGVQHALLSAR